MSQSIDKLLTALKLSEELVNIECSVLTDTITYAKDVTDIVARERQKITATNINVIDAAVRGKLKETGHSRVLYNLLKNKNICTHFIEKLLPGKVFKSLKLDDKITEGVDREKQNIDISIFAEPYFIIIENKVNGAKEQPGQIYRYVQYGLQKTGKDKIYVLYLNKDTRDLPTYYSLKKEGKEDGDEAFSEEMKEKHIIPLSYKNDIYNWISNVYENEKNKYENVKENRERNEFLFSALVQYKDYLENFFELTDKYCPMKKEINEYLIKELELNDKNYSDKIKTLENQIENAGELLKRLENLKKNIELQELNDRFNSRIRNEGEDIRTIPYTKDENWPLFGIEFTINDIPVQCAGEISKDYVGYGIRYSGNENVKTKVNELYDYIIKNLGFTTGFDVKSVSYPIWKDCDINDLVDNTFNLAQEIIGKAKDPNSGFKLKFNLE